MWHRKRYLMQLDRDMNRNNNIEVLVLVSWSVVHVARNTIREIVHRTKVVGLRYTVHERHRLLGTLVKVFHVSMQEWTIGRQNTKHLSLRWKVRFVIKLFLF